MRLISPVPGRSQSQDKFSHAGDLDYSYNQEMSDDGEGTVQPGMRVRHSVFGNGVIMSSSGQGLDQKLKSSSNAPA